MPRQKFKFHLGVLRYFLIAGVLSFAAHLYFGGRSSSILLLGPAIHMATYAATSLEGLGLTLPQQDLTCLLPAVLLYFSAIGFLFRKLLEEKPLQGILSMAGLSVFVLYIHYAAWKNLTLYLQRPF